MDSQPDTGERCLEKRVNNRIIKVNQLAAGIWVGLLRLVVAVLVIRVAHTGSDRGSGWLGSDDTPLAEEQAMARQPQTPL